MAINARINTGAIIGGVNVTPQIQLAFTKANSAATVADILALSIALG